jgi:CheY-specific phosphatase CheX
MNSILELRAVARTGERQMRVQLDEQSVIKANSQFWEQMLAMTLDPMAEPGEFCLSAGHLHGSVTLGGVWKGRIEVRMAEGLAYQATAAMMMQPVETVAEADALDATKEIANMIAGVIKSSLPRPCTMTVPESIVEADGLQLRGANRGLAGGVLPPRERRPDGAHLGAGMRLTGAVWA